MVNFVVTASNPAGPWSDPIHIEGAPGIDPDLFFDDDGRVWYVGNQMPENPSFDGEGEKKFTDIQWKGNNILLFGSEGSGMHQHTSKYADFLVRIDINKKIESLNISNSAAIVFHHLSYLKKRVD